jgi:Flp pilus assembly protein TadG
MRALTIPLKGFAKRLARCRSGNATIIVALGMPMLIGGAGFGTDLAQWYMWKRELQFAVDQGAIAGAWARASDSTKTTYVTRAKQEYHNNLAVTSSFATDATVQLADYNGGIQNSVLVTASATRLLPFSSYLTGSATTISVSAKAVVEGGTVFTTCMLAVDPDADGAFTLGGSVSGSAACGSGALSDSDTAMVKNGNSDADLGYEVSGGGIDSGFAKNGDIHANVDGLSDPFKDLTPPDSPTAQTYFCPPKSDGKTVTTADVANSTRYHYYYKKGKSLKNAAVYTGYSGAQSDHTDTSSVAGATVDNGTKAGTVTSPTVTTTTVVVSGKGNDDSVWEFLDTTTTSTYSNIVVTTTAGSDGIARPQPGTYSSISIACETHFAPGVYVISGNLDFGQNKTIIGSDVMFVLLNGNSMHINSQTTFDLSGITATTLVNNYGMSSDDAAKLAGMLFYDDKSDEDIKINGNSSLAMNGTIYMPHRHITMNGNSKVSGKCLMVVSGTLTFTGNNDLSSFCVPANTTAMVIGGSEKKVRLVE